MRLAPIVIFSYDRPKHLQQTLDALARNEMADQSDLFIFCDGAKPSTEERMKGLTDERYEEYLSRIEENRKIAHAAQGFKSAIVIEREKNIGLKANIVGAVTEIVNQYGRIITLEDDIVTSKGFLRFMNEALEMYKDDEQVMHISGYMWPHQWPLPETFFYAVPYPGGGWATWKRAWQYYDDDAAKLYSKWSEHWDVFNKFGGDYLSKQLVANYMGCMDTWFIKWHAVLLEQGGLTLYPGKSLTNNIGFDEMASNCYETNKFDVVPVDTVIVKRRPIRESWLATHEIYAFYQGRWYNQRRRKALLKKILFWK